MAKYNVIYDKNHVFSEITAGIENTGAQIIEILDALGVLTIESSNTDFSLVAGIIAYDVEQEIVATEHWHLQRIVSRNLPMALYYTPQNFGENSTVYLIDSGVDTTHPEFANSNITNLWSWDNTFDDVSGHGTGVASVIIGETLGVAKQANLKVVKIPFGATITTSVLLNAFNAILNDHLLSDGVKVVNCSWTVPKSSILDAKISELQNHGLIVVAAAGNDIVDANTLSPVGLDSVLGVAASDRYDRVIFWGTNKGSNWGPEVDITAPGINVEAAKLNGTTEIVSGTSIASGIVSGVLCQLITKTPDATSEVIQNALISTGSSDILFRNESIYGGTPNLLVFSPSTPLFITPEPNNRIFNIKKGETLVIPISHVSLINSINISDILIGALKRTVPEWITYSNSSLQISVPTDIPTNRYRIFIAGLNDGSKVTTISILLNIYETDISELDGVSSEMYFSLSSDQTEIVIRQAECTGICGAGYGGCAKGCQCSGSTTTVGTCSTGGAE